MGRQNAYSSRSTRAAQHTSGEGRVHAEPPRLEEIPLRRAKHGLVSDRQGVKEHSGGTTGHAPRVRPGSTFLVLGGDACLPQAQEILRLYVSSRHAHDDDEGQVVRRWGGAQQSR